VKRPKTTKALRHARRAAARHREVQRRKTERQIELGTAKTISWEEATVRVFMGEQLPDDVLVEMPPTPAEKFLYPRVRGVTVEQFDDALKKALGELMASDTPMSPHERKWYGDGLQWLKSQRRRRAIRPESKAQVYNWEIDALVRDGYTVAEAKSKIVAWRQSKP
jgi:hypothetical protein